MGQTIHGGTTVLISNTDNYVRFNAATPAGRAAANGGTPARIYQMRAFVSGNGGTRSIDLIVNGYGSTGAFSRAAAGSAQDTGYRSCSFITSGGAADHYIDSIAGSMYFGRASGSGAVDSYGTGFGIPYFELVWTQVPTAPLSPAVIPGSTTADVSWAAPSDSGGDGINTYRVFYGTDPSLAGASHVDVAGPATAHTVTGLTPGTQYYFAVAAINLCATLAGTTSVLSTIVAGFTGAAPDAPQTPAIAAIAGGIAVSWLAPTTDGGISIDSYVVRTATDAGFTLNVVDTTVNGNGARDKTIVGLTPGTTYYAKVLAHNSVGNGAYSSSVNTATPARDVLDIVKGAAVHLADGTQIEVRSDGGATPVLTLGYVAFGTGSTFVSIATIPTGTSATDFRVLGGPRNIALVADPDGNLYVIGRRGDDASTVLVKRYGRTSSTVWAASGLLSGTLPSTGDTLVAFAATYVPGSPTNTIMLLARRVGTVGAGSLSYGTIDVAAVAASTGTLFIASGSDPAWLPIPPTSAALNSAVVDVAPLVNGGTRIALLGNGYAIIDVVNGVVTGVAKAPNATIVLGPWARVVGINASTICVLTVSSGALAWAFYSTAGSLLGSGSYAGANSFGGAFSSQWDAYYDTVAQLVTAYYVADTAGARTLESIDVSPVTFTNAALVLLSSALGAASTTNGTLRVPEGIVDERRVLVAAANIVTATSAKSTAAYVDTSGNVAPSAPALVDEAGYDATAARVFAWAFSDPNTRDAQTAYQLQIQRVSDSVDIVDSGKITSPTASRSVVGASLVNGVNYRWRVRTYDVLDTVGAWSSYDTFTTAATGTLTVTAPATDNLAGIDTSSYPLTWSYVQADGYTQTQRRVRVIRTSDSVVLSDTTMQASTTGGYTVTGLPSGVEVRIEVSIVTNAPGTPTIGPSNRLITSAYSEPMTPEITAAVGDSYIELVIVNPAPTGDRPDTAYNIVDRRAGSTVDVFEAIGTAPANGTYRDYTVVSGAQYDYRVRGVGE